MNFGFFSLLFIGCFLVSVIATGGILFWLRRRGFVDVPNQRSSHVQPTPRGGGLAVVPVVCLSWIALSFLGAASSRTIGVALCALVLVALSWRDDRRGMSVRTRLAIQLLMVGLGCALLPRPGHVFQGLLPPVLDIAATALLWTWFVNLFNFMDGIDGIAATESASIGFGVAVVAVIIADPTDGAVVLGLAVAGAAVGFLMWNWHPAKLFLGDSGSVPLGFLLGWLLLSLASRGYGAAALILPLYYLVDASWTLIRRAARLQPIWQAHREHFYQRAVQAGHSHSWVVLQILAANIGLVVLAVLALYWPWISVVLAAMLVALLLRRLGGRAVLAHVT